MELVVKMSDEFESMSIEDMVREMELLVEKLENGNVSLEDSLAMYERGAKLRDACQKKLSSYGRRVERLIIQNGEVDISEFD